eukprot:6181569-Pleurochrysis_carterae.AAC.7
MVDHAAGLVAFLRQLILLQNVCIKRTVIIGARALSTQARGACLGAVARLVLGPLSRSGGGSRLSVDERERRAHATGNAACARERRIRVVIAEALPTCPSPPASYAPHVSSAPEVRTTAVWLEPHETAAAVSPGLPKLTGCGSVTASVEPSPSWPRLFEPHEYSLPRSSRRNVCSPPQATVAMRILASSSTRMCRGMPA